MNFLSEEDLKLVIDVMKRAIEANMTEMLTKRKKIT